MVMRTLVWDEESKREMSGMLTTEASSDALTLSWHSLWQSTQSVIRFSSASSPSKLRD